MSTFLNFWAAKRHFFLSRNFDDITDAPLEIWCASRLCFGHESFSSYLKLNFPRVKEHRVIVLFSPEKTKPNRVATIRRGDAATIRRTQTLSVIDPTAAPNHPKRAGRWSSWICYRSAWIIAIPIFAPFPHVSSHIIQSEIVCLFLSNRMCFKAEFPL